MKVLYFDCSMGAAGDMIMAALAELVPDKGTVKERLNTIGIPGIKAELRDDEKCGIKGTHVDIFVNGEQELTEDCYKKECHHDHEGDHEHCHHHDYDRGHEHHGHHHHTSLADIEGIINNLDVSGSVKKNALEVYGIIAEAEGYAHGCDVDMVHFHEVGTMDAVADIVGVCMLIEEIKPDVIKASPISLGTGYVKCAHGILPVPAPATAYIVKDILTESGDEEGELCTPTGAALIKHFASEYLPCPDMEIIKTGIGTGTKDFKKPNCVKAVLGEL